MNDFQIDKKFLQFCLLLFKIIFHPPMFDYFSFAFQTVITTFNRVFSFFKHLSFDLKYLIEAGKYQPFIVCILHIRITS